MLTNYSFLFHYCAYIFSLHITDHLFYIYPFQKSVTSNVNRFALLADYYRFVLAISHFFDVDVFSTFFFCFNFLQWYHHVYLFFYRYFFCSLSILFLF